MLDLSETSSRARELGKAKSEMEMLKKLNKHEDNSAWSAYSLQYTEVMRELNYVKREMSELKLNVASVMEEKARAEKESEGSCSRIRSFSGSVEVLRKEIEEANEEQVLVELSRIEALEEFREVQERREKEASEFSFTMKEYRAQVEDAFKKIGESKNLESKLARTLSDVNILQNGLKLVKAMESMGNRNDSFQHSGGSLEKSAVLEGLAQLKSVTKELEAAKKELAAIREDSFQFMASVDTIRIELKHVAQETHRLKKKEKVADLTIQNLNSEILRAKSKFEAATTAEEKAKSIVASMTVTLDQLRTELEVAKKEKALIDEETAIVEAETQEMKSEADLTDRKLASAMKELEAVMSSESLALDHLQTLTESIMRARASASQNGSSIIISKFEYEYLTGRANGVEEIADKKVAAAQAWIEALRASEREILMTVEAIRREILEKRAEEEREAYRTKRSLSTRRVIEQELRHWRQKPDKTIEADNMQLALPIKHARGNISLNPTRHGN